MALLIYITFLLNHPRPPKKVDIKKWTSGGFFAFLKYFYTLFWSAPKCVQNTIFVTKIDDFRHIFSEHFTMGQEFYPDPKILSHQGKIKITYVDSGDRKKYSFTFELILFHLLEKAL